ncbi:MAG: hypothetical protein ACRC8P_00075 [Spiroplasma sp.]
MNDEELLYLFVVVKNEWAFNCLYQRYQNVIDVLTKKIFYKFFTLPLELSDLQSVTYLIFYQTIVSFQIKKNKSFKNFLLINLKWGLLKYIKKYLTKNHQILNLAVQYQDYFFDDSLNYQESFNYFDFVDLIDLKLSFYEKNVLQLKYQGFSNQEIMTKLNLSYKQVDNAFQRVSLKLKNIKIY